jgi:hypothetical protein
MVDDVAGESACRDLLGELGFPLMSNTRFSGACALAGVLVLLAGCGSSSSGSSKASGTTPANSSGTPPTSSSAAIATPSPTVTPATVVQLKKIVLRPGDLSSSWKAAPLEGGSDDSSDQAQLMKCVGATNTDEDKVATADSNDYTLGNATISSTASRYKSQSDLDSDLAWLKSPKLSPCFNKLLKKQFAMGLGKGVTLGAVSVKFTPGPGSGPANVAGSGLATGVVNANGQHVKVYVNFVYLTGPLIEAEVDAENVGSPVPAAVLQSAVKAVADRAAATS